MYKINYLYLKIKLWIKLGIIMLVLLLGITMVSSFTKNTYSSTTTFVPTSQPSYIFPTVSPNPTEVFHDDDDLQFLVTYVNYEYNNQKEIISSQLFVLEKPFQNPTLIYEDDIVLPGFAWSPNKQKLIFRYENTNHVQVLALYDRTTGLVSPVLTSRDKNEQIIINRFHWSLDSRWFYIPISEEFAIRSQIVDTKTMNITALDYDTQDELLAWSFTYPDEYVEITRPNFPNDDGEKQKILIHRLDDGKTSTVIENFESYTLLSDYFAISPDDTRLISMAVSKSGNPVHLLIDIKTKQSRVILENQNIYVTKYWSPSNKWLVFEKSNGNIFIFDVEGLEQLTQITSNSWSSWAKPLAWVMTNTSGEVLVFRENMSVYGVSPESPEDIFLIQDFSLTLQNFAPAYYQIDIE